MPNSFLTALILIAALFILAPIQIKAKCNLCSKYDVACINEISFNICFGGQPNPNITLTCPPGKLCSDTRIKCVDAKSVGKPTCVPNKGCGFCDGNKIFACTSRTTFAQCNGENLTRFGAACPDGFVCNSGGGEICKDKRNSTAVCDREKPLV